jgi:hypothetical protein
VGVRVPPFAPSFFFTTSGTFLHGLKRGLRLGSLVFLQQRDCRFRRVLSNPPSKGEAIALCPFANQWDPIVETLHTRTAWQNVAGLYGFLMDLVVNCA